MSSFSIESYKEVTDPFICDQMFKDAGSKALNGHEDTTNITVMAEFIDPENKLTKKIFHEGLAILSERHPLLHSSLKIEGSRVFQSTFRQTTLPIDYHKDSKDPEQWREIVKKDLSQRFIRMDRPMWRVSILTGHKWGQLFLTFHHAVSDGLSAAARIHELFSIFAELIDGRKPDTTIVDSESPKLETLYPIAPKPIEKATVQPIGRPLKFSPCCTDFVRHQLDQGLTEALERYAKANGVSVHAVLYAAYIKAVQEIKKPQFNCFNALSIVSLRNILEAPEAMRPLFTWHSDSVNPHLPFLEICREIHKGLHGMIDRKEYEQKVWEVAERMKQKPNPADVLGEKKMPVNMINLSNIGKAKVSETYGALKITGLDAFGGASPYFDYSFLSGGISMSLAVRTFAGKLRMVACFPAEMKQGQNRFDDNVRKHLSILFSIDVHLRRALGWPMPWISSQQFIPRSKM